jgi:hypothetical protein
MVIGRRFELKRVGVVQVIEKTRWADIKAMAGDDELPLFGRRVGESEFRMQSALFSIASANTLPLAAEAEEFVAKNQDGW